MGGQWDQLDMISLCPETSQRSILQIMQFHCFSRPWLWELFGQRQNFSFLQTWWQYPNKSGNSGTRLIFLECHTCPRDRIPVIIASTVKIEMELYCCSSWVEWGGIPTVLSIFTVKTFHLLWRLAKIPFTCLDVDEEWCTWQWVFEEAIKKDIWAERQCSCTMSSAKVQTYFWQQKCWPC